MLPLAGFTEVVGAAGVGKTRVVLSAVWSLKTIYITHTSPAGVVFPPSCLLRRFESFTELRVFIASELVGFVRGCGAEAVVIDGLDCFLYAEYRGRDIAAITYVLKRLAFVLGIQVVVVNTFYGGWRVDGCQIFNSYLGLEWCYAAAARYLLTKTGPGRGTITQIRGYGALSRRYVIRNSVAQVDS